MSFAGKCVVVTGAGSGIGASAARMFLEQGAEVIAVQNRTPAPFGSRRVTMDLARPESIHAAMAEMPDRIDILCNIAGVGADGNTPETIIAANFLGTRLFTEQMLDRVAGDGCVINTSSVAARNWRRDIALVRQIMAMRDNDEIAPFWAAAQREHQASYALAKSALIAWTMQQAHLHLKSGPRFNVVSPGFTDTPMLQRAFAQANASVLALAKSNNSISSPDDVAKVFLFLCSDEARVINGTEIVADAGLMSTMHCGEFQL